MCSLHNFLYKPSWLLLLNRKMARYSASSHIFLIDFQRSTLLLQIAEQIIDYDKYHYGSKTSEAHLLGAPACYQCSKKFVHKLI